MDLLDTTLLSNFARIGRLDLLMTILPEAMTTPQVLAELDKGEAAGWLPESEWEWLGVVTLSANESEVQRPHNSCSNLAIILT